MIVRFSHRIEDLVAALAVRVAVPAIARADGDGVLDRETIAVQGRGMERWLSMELSRRLGVWANPDFPFPRSLVERAFDCVLGPADVEPARFEPDALTWAVADLLESLLSRPAFEDLERYLAADPSPARRVQLASRIAQTFDHYVIYRPEMIAAWEAGSAGRDWQPMLWRELVARTGRQHLAARAEQFLAAIEGGAGQALDGFPARVSLFGVTTLPPLYVEVLAALARRVDVQLFVLRPTRRPLASAPGDNPLWSSLGEVGRQFHQVLGVHSVQEQMCEESSVEAPSGASSTPSLLEAVQRAVREGVGAPNVGERAQSAPSLDDGSIRVHACHGPMREVEVLRDQLRAIFESDPSLEPRDVIVMTPDVERYAPFIEAVFDAAPSAAFGRDEGAAIDYRIADRRVRATHPVVDALWALLDALSGRLTASAVVDLLMVDRIREKFGIRDDEIEVLIDWIGHAGIRWGVDAAHRGEVGQPALGQNTWQQGIDRLMLALAMPPGGRSLFAGALPAEGVDPGLADLLGRFVEFAETLFSFRESLFSFRASLFSFRESLFGAPASVGPLFGAHETPGLHRLDRWRDLLSQLMDRAILPGPDGAQQQARIRDALRGLAERASDAGFDEAVPLSIVREEIASQLERGVESHRFLTGGVTFCELVPMRSIPFRVVALLGMNDEAFPRSRVPLGFDLVAKNPRSGDRTTRDDDRYLFLEALVSARDHLIVTYAGSSLRDGSRRPPSVVVGELVDECLRLAGANDRKKAIEGFVVQHPLHTFSARYFDGSDARLFSYSGAARDGAQVLLDARAAGAREEQGSAWVRSPLPIEDAGAGVPEQASPEREVQVELSELARFFEHPVRGFLQHRFGLYLRDEVEPLEDREALALDALDRWIHGDALIRAELSGLSPAAAGALVRADGRLPPGAIGDAAERASHLRVAKILDEVRGLRGGDSLRPIPVDLRLGRWRLQGEIGSLWPTGRVVHQLSALPHPKEINFWIHHLVLSQLAPQDTPRSSYLVGRKGDGADVLTLPPCDDPEPVLRDLLELYALGQTLPLPLLRRTSLGYAKECVGKEWGRPSPSVVRGWNASFSGGTPRDREDFYLAQAFRDIDPLEPEAPLPGIGFSELARRVYEPYLQALASDK